MAKVRRPIVTLLTDFGTSDPYVAAMKGVLLQANPFTCIVDVTHEIPPHDILTAAFVLAGAVGHFPPETLHVVVVDPGVGTDRSLLAGRFGDQRVLFPDNGVIHFVQEALPLDVLVAVRNTRYLPRENPSATFHGRDVFAPLAGRILQGVSIDDLGPVPARYKLLDLDEPRRAEGRIAGRVLHVDRFGNLITNLSARVIRAAWPDVEDLEAECRGRKLSGISPAYASVAAGRPAMMFNSYRLLELAVNRGRADEHFQAGVGTEVIVRKREFLDV
jgi:S-adenosylmethionine hydrolase